MWLSCKYSWPSAGAFFETLPYLMILGQLHRQAQSPLQSQRAEGHLGVYLDDRASSHGRLAHAWLRANNPAFIRRLIDALQRCKLNRYKIPRRDPSALRAHTSLKMSIGRDSFSAIAQSKLPLCCDQCTECLVSHDEGRICMRHDWDGQQR